MKQSNIKCFRKPMEQFIIFDSTNNTYDIKQKIIHDDITCKFLYIHLQPSDIDKLNEKTTEIKNITDKEFEKVVPNDESENESDHIVVPYNKMNGFFIIDSCRLNDVNIQYYSIFEVLCKNLNISIFIAIRLEEHDVDWVYNNVEELHINLKLDHKIIKIFENKDFLEQIATLDKYAIEDLYELYKKKKIIQVTKWVLCVVGIIVLCSVSTSKQRNRD